MCIVLNFLPNELYFFLLRSIVVCSYFVVYSVALIFRLNYWYIGTRPLCERFFSSILFFRFFLIIFGRGFSILVLVIKCLVNFFNFFLFEVTFLILLLVLLSSFICCLCLHLVLLSSMNYNYATKLLIIFWFCNLLILLSDLS